MEPFSDRAKRWWRLAGANPCCSQVLEDLMLRIQSRLRETFERCKSLSISAGDFLLTRSNTKELVGQVCIVDRPMQNTISQI